MKYREDNFYIDRILSGEVAAYASLVEKHKDLVFSIALRILNNREDAEEVAQDAFVKAYQSLKTFERKSKFSTWLYRIVYNAAVSKTRKKKMEFVAMNEAIIQNYTESEITERVDHLDENDQRALMERAVKRLPEEDHLLVTLFYHADHSIDEISYITGLSASNVKVRLHRIRKRLYEEISEMMKAEMV
jgi:RNA polymerase sigma-70 factor (ECF subfamily)